MRRRGNSRSRCAVLARPELGKTECIINQHFVTTVTPAGNKPCDDYLTITNSASRGENTMTYVVITAVVAVIMAAFLAIEHDEPATWNG
jgi:hypothetical protein